MSIDPIHLYIPNGVDDPRERVDLPENVIAHRGPPLHPDDTAIVDGLPVTSPSRTLIDLAEILCADELRECFARARELGLLEPAAFTAARARVEWRPSLAMLDRIAAEFL